MHGLKLLPKFRLEESTLTLWAAPLKVFQQPKMKNCAK